MKDLRVATVKRSTEETKVTVSLNLDGTGCADIDTGIGFLDHMLVLFISHGQFDIDIKAKGDTYVDCHHTTEDVGIVLGKAFYKALGDRKGINRYGATILPMDESLAMVNVDISGRPYLHYNVKGLSPILGDMDSQSFEEFFRGFVNHCRATVHINLLYGKNSHHIIEGIFKAFARALKKAVTHSNIDKIPSTKGLLD